MLIMTGTSRDEDILLSSEDFSGARQKIHSIEGPEPTAELLQYRKTILLHPNANILLEKHIGRDLAALSAGHAKV